MSDVRVRFAPSPTGYLHVGGARTAIFNWLYARRHGGRFILRIEDTDTARSSEDMTAAILDGMAWLGVKPDEGPHFQSQARERHQAEIIRLVDAGKAYRCYCDPEELKRQRMETEKSGGNYTYPGTCRELSGADPGRPFAVRFKVPKEEVSWDDLVHGETSFDASLLEDFVIARRDGSPTYMLSVVCDDAGCGITHIIRGDDHISNTPKQILLYRALGHDLPRFAHIPLILGEDKKRLSKRHGAMSVLQYREMGYTDDAMFNFLSLLGWSPGDDRQKMSREELVEAFDLSGVGKSGAVFDLQKLEWLNGQYIDELPVEELEPWLRADLEKAGLWEDRYAVESRDWFLKVLELLQPRARTFRDLLKTGEFFFYKSEDFEYEAKPAKKHLKGESLAENLEKLRSRLEAMESWTPEPMEQCLRGLAEELGIGAGKLIHPTRLAVTGRGATPGLFEVLELIGKEKSLSRIGRLVDLLKNSDRLL